MTGGDEMDRQGRSQDEDRDSVAPQPERSDPADAGGDSPGPEIGVPDEPAASDRHGTTADEQREPSLERRLAMERPDVSDADPPAAEPGPRPLVDDDVPAEDLEVEDRDFDVDEADLDRSGAEVGEETSEQVDDGPEEAAMHIEPE
jgi:hypothetical protein